MVVRGLPGGEAPLLAEAMALDHGQMPAGDPKTLGFPEGGQSTVPPPQKFQPSTQPSIHPHAHRMRSQAGLVKGMAEGCGLASLGSRPQDLMVWVSTPTEPLNRGSNAWVSLSAHTLPAKRRGSSVIVTKGNVP